MSKTALITGITGQDGSLLAELLLNKGYVVHGVKRRASQHNTQRIDHLYVDRHEQDARLFLHYGDLSDAVNITRIIQQTQPDEIYNLAAMSHVHVSFEMPLYTGEIDALGIVRIMEAVKLLGLEKKTKIYQAATSEIYGSAPAPQNEDTIFQPRSPYAAAKLYAYWMVRIYREAHGLFACNGILFNHESPTRGETFVTRKITRAVASLALGSKQTLFLGNLDAKRDWGHARDYVKAMHKMLQQDEAEDFVIATGKTLTVRQFAKKAFGCLGVELDFLGEGVKEQAQVKSIDTLKFKKMVGQLPTFAKGDTLIQVLPEYFRPLDVHLLKGDASKAHQKLDWKPECDIEQLVEEMVTSDLKIYKSDPTFLPQQLEEVKVRGEKIG